MTVSDSDLHAFVDGELTGEKFVRLGKEIQNCPECFGRACKLQMLKNLIRQAYKTVPIPHDGWHTESHAWASEMFPE